MTNHHRRLKASKQDKNTTNEQDLSNLELAYQTRDYVREHDNKQNKGLTTFEISRYCPLLQRNI